MKRLKSLDLYQRFIMISMVLMILIFSVMYALTISRVGFEYHDSILVASTDNGQLVYSGVINGKKSQFIVNESNEVSFQYGDKTYGEYRVLIDSAAIPEELQSNQDVIGVEVYCGEELIFRGGAWNVNSDYWLFDEKGSPQAGVTYIANDGEWYQNGQPVDRMKPTASTILKLLNNPELTHKGDLLAFCVGLLICVINIFDILFADELFRFGLSFRIRDAENAVPSEWEITGRYIAWTAFVGMALFVFWIGLRS